MSSKLFIPALPVLLSLLAVLAPAQTDRPPEGARGVASRRPRLVLQITVDQLRGDLIRRYADRWGQGGFRRLLEEGAVFANAHHAHANTVANIVFCILNCANSTNIKTN